ncbi:MAG: GWxTD domain-containing protein [Candidatus Aminicenantales bacterium]
MSEWSRQWLEEVVVYIITPAEKQAFLMLANEAERGQFIESFWKKRDPDPATPKNELKDAFYRRIALANKYFGASGIAGWRTDRGRTYILLGPPHQIERDFGSTSTANSSSTGYAEKETWQYWGLPNPKLPYNVEFAFVDKFGNGSFVLDRNYQASSSSANTMRDMTYQFDQLDLIAETQRNPFENLPAVKPEVTTEVSTDLLPFQFRLYTFKGDGGKVHIPLIIDVPYSSLPTKAIDGKEYASLNLVARVDDAHGKALAEKNRTLNFLLSPEEKAALKNEALQVQTSLDLDPGDYEIQVILLDNFSGKIGMRRQVYTAPVFENGEMTMSDIVLSAKTAVARVDLPGEKAPGSAGTSLPSASRNTFHDGEEMEVTLEVYHLAVGPETNRPSLRVEFAVLRGPDVFVTIPPMEPETDGRTECRIQNSFKLKNFPPGPYTLRATISDAVAAKTASKEVVFGVVK